MENIINNMADSVEQQRSNMQEMESAFHCREKWRAKQLGRIIENYLFITNNK